MIDIDGQHEWRDCLDLPGVQLPRGYYFGATALTGDLSGNYAPQGPKFASASRFRNAFSWFWLTDNHDIISLKLYELTVIRSDKEEKEEEEEEEITIPSVDNIELLRRMTNTPFYAPISFNKYPLTSFFPPVGSAEEGMSSIAMFFTLLFSMLGCIFLIIIGIVMYGQWKESRRKRFYWWRSCETCQAWTGVSAGSVLGSVLGQCRGQLRRWNAAVHQQGAADPRVCNLTDRRRKMLHLLWLHPIIYSHLFIDCGFGGFFFTLCSNQYLQPSLLFF